MSEQEQGLSESEEKVVQTFGAEDDTDMSDEQEDELKDFELVDE
jgi:hypothetical protein